MLVFLMMRAVKTLHALKDKNHAQNSLVSHVYNAITNFRLIADYNRRPLYIEKLMGRIAKLNRAITFANVVTKNNQYFAPWLSTIIVGMYTLSGGTDVYKNVITLGDFLVNLQIFQEIGISWGNVYA